MKLWVGLGNPGTAYAQNRHNIGFMAVDRLADAFSFSAWKHAGNAASCSGMIGSAENHPAQAAFVHE